MGKNSNIEWTDDTWNPWHGCKKVSPGCKYCYMFRDKERWKKDPTEVIKSKSFQDPLKWAKIPANNGLKIFTCSWSDFFIEEADQWREEAWDVIKNTPNLTYQILTKRPERIKDCLPYDWGEGYENVWIGVSIESEKQLSRIIDLCIVPCKLRFISFEPLLSKIDVNKLKYAYYYDMLISHIHWAIIGGESGNDNGKYRYRPCELIWIESLTKQLKGIDLPVFIKQTGTYIAKNDGRIPDRHGRDIKHLPEILQIRELPNNKKL